MEKRPRDRDVLFSLSSLVQEELNIRAILPYLKTAKHDLTTNEEREILLNSSTCDIQKKQQFLLLWLPSKGNNSLDRFIEALKESKGTTHETLARKIQDERLAKANQGTHCKPNH